MIPAGPCLLAVPQSLGCLAGTDFNGTGTPPQIPPHARPDLGLEAEAETTGFKPWIQRCPQSDQRLWLNRSRGLGHAELPDVP